MTQKKDRRKAYLDAYRQNEHGSYVYCGDLYLFEGDAKRLTLRKAQCLLDAAVLFISLLSAGFLQTPGVGRCMYVMLPYAAALCGSISVCWGVLRFCAAPSALPAHSYEEFVKKLPNRALFTACCCIVCLVGLILHLIWNGADTAANSFFCFPLLHGIALLAAFRIRVLIFSTKWKKEVR